MPAELIGPVPSWADVGDTWRVLLAVTDLDGTTATPTAVTVSVTLPSGLAGTITATPEPTAGLYWVAHDVTVAGEHTVQITVTDDVFGDDVVVTGFTATSITSPGFEPATVITYLGDSTSATAAEVADALAAEVEAQKRVCRIPVPYPADLAQALKRRVARNLAARMVPVASFTAFEGGTTSARVPANDVEVRRFEAPYRRLPVA